MKRPIARQPRDRAKTRQEGPSKSIGKSVKRQQPRSIPLQKPKASAFQIERDISTIRQLRRILKRQDPERGARREEWAWLSKVFRSRRPRALGRRWRGNPNWKALVEDGMDGALAQMLNREPIPEFGRVLVWLFKKGGWKEVQLWMLLQHPFANTTDSGERELWRQALKESLIFEACGFSVAQCEYRKHYYLTDDQRRKDCPRHRFAGQQARWRQRNPLK